MKLPTRPPSLRRGLMARMLLPAVVLAVALGLGGAWVIHGVVETTNDRLLDGAVLAIAERLSLDEDNDVTVDLPRAALGMLESQAQDRIYYSVTQGGTLVTGYRDLPQAGGPPLSPGKTVHWDGEMRGVSVRVAAQARRLYGTAEPVLVEVAETRDARRVLEFRLLGSLAMLEVLLLGLVGLLAWFAIGRGLRPLTDLSADLSRHAAPGAVNLQPLETSRVPQEALPPVLAFNAVLQRLSDSMEAIRRFTSDAAHQMRTPLTIMRMHVELIRWHQANETAPPVAITSGLDDIEAATRRLEQLLTQLLSLARAEEAGAENALPIGPMDLVETVTEIVSERVPNALARDIDIQFERDTSEASVLAHPTLVREIVGNLLDNAIHYNRVGGSATVRVIGGSTPRVEIEDDGPGIPEAEQTKVFERFYRVVRAGTPEGSGLGLAIVRTLADRIGAAVTLANRQPGPGLLATVTFPQA